MTLTYTNSKTEARVLKAVKALSLTQTKAPTKEPTNLPIVAQSYSFFGNR